MTTVDDLPVANGQPSLAGTSVEFRAALTQFGSGAGCVASTRPWGAPTCGKTGTWLVTCQDAHSGVTYNGDFTPAVTQVVLCDEHRAAVWGEPRHVFGALLRTDPDVRRASVSFITMPTMPWDEPEGGESP